MKRKCEEDAVENSYEDVKRVKDTMNSSSSDSSSLVTTSSFKDGRFFVEDDQLPWEYTGVVAAAPMVRVSHLPFRLTCKDYGCRMMYTEEVVAKKQMNCVRVEQNGIINFVDRDRAGREKSVILSDLETNRYLENELQSLYDKYPSGLHGRVNANPTAFSTYKHERLVLQLGVSNGTDLLHCMNLVGNDVRAIDINMGCPKQFSLQGNMGSALLTDPEAMEDQFKTLQRNSNLPYTGKIRMLPDLRDTVEVIQRLEHLGVSAIGVHCRMKEDRPRYRSAPMYQFPELQRIANVPLLYNGDVFVREDIDRTFGLTQASGLQVARGCLWNPAIFGGKGGILDKYIDKSLFTPEVALWRDAYSHSRQNIPLYPSYKQDTSVSGIGYTFNTEEYPEKVQVADQDRLQWKYADEEEYMNTCKSDVKKVLGDSACLLHAQTSIINFAVQTGTPLHIINSQANDAMQQVPRMTKTKHFVTIRTCKQSEAMQNGWMGIQDDPDVWNRITNGFHPHFLTDFSPRDANHTGRSKKNKKEMSILRTKLESNKPADA